MKRILLVHGETMALQGLQRMLRSTREKWEMEFVQAGERALERMAQSPFDVVVSELRIPGMNGAELLAHVMKRFPKMLRLILSGSEDKELTFKCVATTH